MKNTFITFLIIFNFALGIYAGVFFHSFYNNEFEVKEEVPQENRQTSITALAPFDRIHERNIEVYPEEIRIKLHDLEGKQISWSNYADTGSMTPTLGKGCNGLEFVPTSAADIHKGDMIAFTKEDALIIHRVIRTSIDAKGWLAETKGDSNRFSDGIVRFKDIKFVTFAIVC